MMCPTCDRLRAELREVKEELEEWRMSGDRQQDDGVAIIQKALGVAPQTAKIISCLMTNPSTLTEMDRLIEAMEYNGQGRDFLIYGNTDEGRSLKVGIHSARRALERVGVFDAIGNVWGKGYIMPRSKVNELRAILEAA